MEEEKKKTKKKKEEVKEERKKTNKGLLIIVVIAALLLVAGVLAGSRKMRDLMFSRFLSRTTGTDVNVEKGGKKTTVKTKEGEFSFESEGKLPENFPSDFPIYPGAKLTSSWTTTGEGSNGLSLLWETGDSVTKVKEYYEGKLKSAGWKVSFSSTNEDSSTLAFEKDGTSGFLGITVEDKKTIISLTLGI